MYLVSRGGERNYRFASAIRSFSRLLNCRLEPHRTICFISARIVGRARPSNARGSFRFFHSFHSFHCFHKETRLHPSDCKGFIHSAKKSALASPPESVVCALFHKTPGGYPPVAPNSFLFFPHPVNTRRTGTPATPFLSNAYFIFLWIPGGGALPPIRHPSEPQRRPRRNFVVILLTRASNRGGPIPFEDR